MPLSPYIPLCKALVLLMKPLVEIVIHDLKSGTICHIEGSLSVRKVGDPSLLDPSELEKNIDKIVYPKLNFDGRLIKSISVPIEDKWLVCINCDVSIFTQIQNLSQKLLGMSEPSNSGLETSLRPESLFKNDWQERLHIAIHSHLREKGWVYEDLNGRQKKEIAKHLFDINAFYEKNAADYVATTLSLGRATVFKYLKEWRQ